MDEEKLSVGTRMKSFGVKCLRVWHVLRKPTREEFKNTAKISAIGIAIVGLLGFVISMLMIFFKPLF